MPNWGCGWLDSELLPEIAAVRPDFKISDINSQTVPQSLEGSVFALKGLRCLGSVDLGFRG